MICFECFEQDLGGWRMLDTYEELEHDCHAFHGCNFIEYDGEVWLVTSKYTAFYELQPHACGWWHPHFKPHATEHFARPFATSTNRAHGSANACTSHTQEMTLLAIPWTL